MYRLIEIDDLLNDQVVAHHQKGHFLQLGSWAKFKSLGDWQPVYLGLYDEEQLIASSMFLKRKIPLIGGYIYYAPRGFMIDFNNQSLFKEWTNQLKTYLKKHQGVYLIVDPDLVYRHFNSHGDVIEGPNDDLMNMFKENGYQHQGFNLNFEMLQPRFTFRLDLTKSMEDIDKGIDRSLKRLIKTADEAEVEVVKSDRIDLFYELMQDTAKRDGFIEHQMAYYQQMYDCMHPLNQADLYLAYYYPSKHQEKVKKQWLDLENKLKPVYDKYDVLPKKYQELERQCDKLEVLLKQLDETAKQYPNGVVVSGIITGSTDDKIWSLYGGNHQLSRDIGASQAIYYQIIKDAKASGKTMMDFFGASGDIENKQSPLYGLYHFKKRFGGEFVEFIGEFHLIIRPLKYRFVTNVIFKLRDYLVERRIKKNKNN